MIQSNYVYHVNDSQIAITTYDNSTFTIAVDGVLVYGNLPKVAVQKVPVGEIHPDITFSRSQPS
jgi:hypothetical protein